MEPAVTQSLRDALQETYGDLCIRVEPLEASLKLLQLAAVRVRYMPEPMAWSPYVDVFPFEDFDGA